mmetsp:Transcript_34495/g.83481  ORF Transcript_34495/g.83481 Transcript_34495/m.83481 type:complete len:82 (+) Transcript_34495:1689-1934(+)
MRIDGGRPGDSAMIVVVVAVRRVRPLGHSEKRAVCDYGASVERRFEIEAVQMHRLATILILVAILLAALTAMETSSSMIIL